MKTCKDVMTSNPICCVAEDNVIKAAQMMAEQNVGSIPVVEDTQSKKLIGIITDRDITANVVARHLVRSTVRVIDAMSRELIVCRDNEPVAQAVQAMAAHQVRRIPVVDKKNRIAGIISQGDVELPLNAPE